MLLFVKPYLPPQMAFTPSNITTLIALGPNRIIVPILIKPKRRFRPLVRRQSAPPGPNFGMGCHHFGDKATQLGASQLSSSTKHTRSYCASRKPRFCALVSFGVGVLKLLLAGQLSLSATTLPLI